MKKNDKIEDIRMRFWPENSIRAFVGIALLTAASLFTPLFAKDSKQTMKPTPDSTIDYKSQPDSYWKEKLTPEQYYILRKKGTERAFTGKYHAEHGHGIYRCAGCGQELFSSEQKFDSGTGWPSFWAPTDPKNVDTKPDRSLFVTRVEVLCSRCGGHLGHVFDDGPAPTGKRFCMNSSALTFEKK